MAKAKKVEYGIEITKPWSKEMYNHNDKVADEVRDEVWERWAAAYKEAEAEFKSYLEEDQIGLEFADSEFTNANQEMKDIQSAVTMYRFGSGFDIRRVEEEIMNELECIAYYRLKEIVEELEIELVEGFIGL